MQNLYDYKKFLIIYVDDEEKSLKYFTRAFADQFRILTATNADEGFKLFEKHKDEIAILMTDQRMPGEKGVQLLERARALRPRVIRMLATAYSDLEAAIAAVNTGAIYKYVHKPWDVPQLEVTLKRALEFFAVQMERDQLFHEKLSVLQNMIITDRVISLGVLAAGLNHHLRNPMAAVRTFLDLAPAKLREEQVNLEGLRNPNYWKEFYEHVQGQVGRMTDMLNELGAFSDKTKSTFSDVVQLSQVIDNAIGKFKPELDAKQIRVETNVPATLPEFKVDGPKFQRIFDLLIKSEAASLPGGSVVTINASAGGNATVAIEIKDNGPGMPQNDLRAVFNPFFARKEESQEFGINLMTCYFLVYHHGGTVEVASNEGQGTVFKVILPLNPPAEASTFEDRKFVSKVLANEELWDKLMSNG